MPSEEFENQPEDDQKRFSQMRSMMNYGMGILWLCMGIFLLMPDKFSDDFAKFDDPVIKIFAVVCIAYALFRIYRGYKKNYYN